jgi:hypothetical protein
MASLECGDGTAPRLVRSDMADARDMLEVWWRGECRQTRQKALAYNVLAAFRQVTGVVVSPWVNIVLQKTPRR